MEQHIPLKPSNEKAPYLSALSAGGASVLLILFLSSLGLDIMQMPLRGDNKMYFFVSERIASGRVPYECHFDPKTSLSMMVSGLVIAAGRLVDVSGVTSVRIFSLLLVGFAAGLGWLIMWQLSHSRRASVFAVLSLFSFPGYLALTIMGSRPKALVMVIIFLILLAYFRRRFLLAALFISLGFLCWQPVIMFLPVLLLLSRAEENGFGRFPAILLVTAVPIILYELYFVLAGNFYQQLVQAFYYPYVFMSGSGGDLLARLGRFRQSWLQGFGVLNPINIAFPPGVVGLLYLTTRRNREVAVDEGKRNLQFLLISLVLAFVFTAYSHQGFPDLFLVFPFTVIVSAWALDRFVELFSGWKGKRPALLTSILAGCLLVYPTLRVDLTVQYQFTLSDQRELAEEVGRYLEEGKSVYAMGCTHLLALNHADNWLNQGYFSDTVNDYLEAKRGGEPFRPVKDGQWPSVILLSGTPPRDAGKWLEERYVDVTTRRFRRQDIRVFERMNRFVLLHTCSFPPPRGPGTPRRSR